MNQEETHRDILPISRPVPSSNWRAMGMWNTGAEFLLTLGDSEADCKLRMLRALDELNYAELLNLDSIWLEHWMLDEVRDAFAWLPTEELSLRRIRLRAAARQQHAMKRSA